MTLHTNVTLPNLSLGSDQTVVVWLEIGRKEPMCSAAATKETEERDRYREGGMLLD